MVTILDGRAVAQRLQAGIAVEVAAFKQRYGAAPGLGVVMAGDNPASQMYVKMKRRACAEVGMESLVALVDADTSQAAVEQRVQAYNDNPAVHGILVQLPLPRHIDEERVLGLVSLAKDVDGFHPVNIGALAMKGREPTFAPATPSGCMVLLQETGVPIRGANAVVIGRSNIVGLPMALLLLKADATVTMCHSRTRDLPAVVRQADIVVAAIGQPEFVRGDWLKPGCVVIDVGTNRVDDPTQEKGYRYVGDVAYDEAAAVAGWITKVPGGVGPMTITMLLQNTLKAARRSAEGQEG
ncbi:MAG: bifunctional 5,10-methylenetetrahydrofolate dehydrogenase/5,10-methenyltetrahydrofolate cyclohydrolase [Anaerolineae bacterium]|nr:bifunctional 5,10-methylenetetrahydrofolate dehydrogenase/5,10-methenyltetrahydrofolate cyclohydrolase [Anaerolineae bacterium]